MREEQSRRIVQPTTETRETDRDRRRWSHERLVAIAIVSLSDGGASQALARSQASRAC
jgi:hypothetical protein